MTPRTMTFDANNPELEQISQGKGTILRETNLNSDTTNQSSLWPCTSDQLTTNSGVPTIPSGPIFTRTTQSSEKQHTL